MANLEETVPSDQDDEYSEDLFSDEEVQCHMYRLEWDQARLKKEVRGGLVPPSGTGRRISNLNCQFQLHL